jgi:hypothetical protein
LPSGFFKKITLACFIPDCFPSGPLTWPFIQGGKSAVAERKKRTRFGIDDETGRLVIARWSVPMPRSRLGRIGIGSGLVVCGCLGFLPILGFWMLPLGFLVLSQDVPVVRRAERGVRLWWLRRRRRRRDGKRV